MRGQLIGQSTQSQIRSLGGSLWIWILAITHISSLSYRKDRDVMLDFDLDGEITPAMLGQIRIVYGGAARMMGGCVI